MVAKLTEESQHIVINKSADERAHWYVVHTYSGQETRVAEQLRQRVEAMGFSDIVLEILIPTQEKIEIRAGAKQTVKEKIFPGYLLVSVQYGLYVRRVKL